MLDLKRKSLNSYSSRDTSWNGNSVLLYTTQPGAWHCRPGTHGDVRARVDLGCDVDSEVVNSFPTHFKSEAICRTPTRETDQHVICGAPLFL